MPTRRRLVAAAVLLCTALAGTPALVSPAGAAADRSDRATARAAERYGVSESALRERMQRDPNLHLAASGAAYYTDPRPTNIPRTTSVLNAPFPLGDTFELHSKSGSQRTIYLDFNGGNVSNTAWNSPAGGNVTPGTHPAMDLAGDGPSFNDTELAQVQDIFQRVAEDYAPFDVDVTTEEPPAAALDRSGASDRVYGTRAMITPSTSAAGAICNNQCGGVAFIGVFNHYAGLGSDNTPHEGYQPAWIFPQLLNAGNQVKNIAEATTHEVGHTLGLDHDGYNNQGYYGGHDMWAPIMGAGYNRPIVQFALSDYPGADLGGPTTPLQTDPDDIVTITNTGLSFRADEPGTSTANAGGVPAGSAYISNRTDVDYFALGTCSGNVTVAANNAPVSPNLDIELQLLDASGATIDIDNPDSAYSTLDVATGMDATATGASLPSGQYYARVDGIGRGSATTSYTDYGSIGAYTLTVTGCTGVSQAKPGKPRIGAAKPGKRGGKLTATIGWQAPSGTTLPAIDHYRVVAYRENNRGKFAKVSTSPELGPNTDSISFTSKSKARLKFAVQAHNSLGWGKLSSLSNAVRPR